MKNIFRPTIFKKIFFVLLTGFMFINTMHIYFDYLFTCERVKSTLWSYDNVFAENVVDLCRNYSNKYSSLNDSNYHKEIIKFRDTYELTDNLCILDNEFRIVKDFTKHKKFFIEFIGDLNDGHGSQGIFEVSDKIPLSTIERVNTYILGEKEKGTDKPYVPVQYSSKDGKLTGLVIGDVVVYEIQDDHFVAESAIETYESHNLGVYDYAVTYGTNTMVVNYEKIKEDVLDNCKNDSYFALLTEPDYILGGSGESFIANGNIYNYHLYPILKPETQRNEEGLYSLDQIEGYMLVYNYVTDGLNGIKNDVFNSKIVVYVGSFVCIIITCWVISSMLSRRIKNIDKGTRKISEGDFDVKLWDPSKDEIGVLTKNINIMSEKINEQVENLNNEIERVKKLECMKSEFIANFTHEMKTPLSIINGYIEIMDETQDEEKKNAYLDAIHKETDKVNELVSSMLNLSRLQSGSVELNIQLLELDEIISTCLDEFSFLVKNKELQVFVNSDSSTILADEKEMCIVLRNFMSNAIKHTDNSGKITITVKDKVLYIENQGSHIDEERMQVIWNTYVSGDRDGTGLGLAINKAILDLHEFSYAVYNTDTGVCFKVVCKKGG